LRPAHPRIMEKNHIRASQSQPVGSSRPRGAPRQNPGRRVKLSGKIKVYALSTCPYCRRTKKYLDEQGIDYEAVDVDLLEGEEQDRVLREVEGMTGRQSFPVIVTDAGVIVGHDEEKLRRALAK
jgi:glutaredoxin-like protein NrdH